MTVGELASAMELSIHVEGNLNREVTGGFCSDLLSWAMGRASSGDAWMTVINNVNVIAVAQLADVACVILTQDSEPMAEIKSAAEQNGIPVLLTSLPTYETAVKISRLIPKQEP